MTAILPGRRVPPLFFQMKIFILLQKMLSNLLAWTIKPHPFLSLMTGVGAATIVPTCEHEVPTAQPHSLCWCLCNPFSSATTRDLSGQQLRTRPIPSHWGCGAPTQGPIFKSSFDLTCSRICSSHCVCRVWGSGKATQSQPDPYLLVFKEGPTASWVTGLWCSLCSEHWCLHYRSGVF